MRSRRGARRATTSTGTRRAADSACTSTTLKPATAMPWSSTARTCPSNWLQRTISIIRAVELAPSRRTREESTPSRRVRAQTVPTSITSPRCACGNGASSNPTTFVRSRMQRSMGAAPRCGRGPAAGLTSRPSRLTHRPMRELSIDVVSDIVCPWCLIGARRLEQALATFPDVEASVTFHPFLLDPTTPDEGVDLRERLERKYGVPAESMFARVESAARESGIPLDFAEVRRSVATSRAHTLLRHAIARGTQRALKHALLDAYFLEGRDVGSADVLAEIASAHGFDADEARAIVRDDGELRRTREEAASAAAQGISGVPFFVIGGRLAFSGAQSVDTMRTVIARALDEST
jgi:predicted DsbA family dithiol-disulfide isomerase